MAVFPPKFHSMDPEASCASFPQWHVARFMSCSVYCNSTFCKCSAICSGVVGILYRSLLCALFFRIR